MNWLYKGKPLFDVPEDKPYGFAYRITYSNDKKYIGKKAFFSQIKKPFGKRELKEVIDKRLKRYKVIIKESNWKKYKGSHHTAENLIIAKKEILEMCNDKLNLTYAEMKHQVLNNILTDDDYINISIAGKYFRGRIDEQRN